MSEFANFAYKAFALLGEGVAAFWAISLLHLALGTLCQRAQAQEDLDDE